MEAIKVVTALILDECDRVLVQQRGFGHPYPGYWETPGGKQEPGEDPIQALKRELKEELDLHSVEVIHRPLLSIGYSPPIGMGEYDVTIYRVVLSPGSIPRAMENQFCVKFCSLLEMDSPRVPSLTTMMMALHTIYPLTYRP